MGMIFRQVFTDGSLCRIKVGGWLDTEKGRPHSDALHVTERFRRTDYAHMEIAITINDPQSLPETGLSNYAAARRHQTSRSLLRRTRQSHGAPKRHAAAARTAQRGRYEGFGELKAW
jgi:hypothetical protein